MKIAVAGVGYVGLSLATLLSRHHKVYAFDISEDKVNSLWLPEIPLVMFYDAEQAASYTNFEKSGYTYFQLSPGYSNLFTTADSSIAAIDTMREIIR